MSQNKHYFLAISSLRQHFALHMAIFGKILEGDPWFGPLVVIRKCEWGDRSDWRGLLAVKLWGNWHGESDRNWPVCARIETDDVNQTRWLTSDDLQRVIASCLFWYPILTDFLYFICGHPNQDVGGELILDCKKDIEILHEYFRPRGCIKYCLWEDKTLDHLARVKELMGLDESRETSRTQCGWQPWWNQPLYRLWDLNALCINYCAADTAATNCKLWFFFVNKQNSKTRFYFQRCSLLLNDAENSLETAYWPSMVYKPHHTTQ